MRTNSPWTVVALAVAIGGAACGGSSDPGAAKLLEPGSACKSDGQCMGNHCDSGTCCYAGTCCLTALDCPASFHSAASCGTGGDCQGTREDAICEGYVCGSRTVNDDSACQGGSHTCGAYQSVACTGAIDDTPVCGTSCAGAGDCASGFACNGSSQCVAAAGTGAACSAGTPCAAGLKCGDYQICCAATATKCCNNSSDCAATCTECVDHQCVPKAKDSVDARCATGTCRPGTCDSAGACTIATGQTCDDGNSCSGGDACTSGAVCAGCTCTSGSSTICAGGTVTQSCGTSGSSFILYCDVTGPGACSLRPHVPPYPCSSP